MMGLTSAGLVDLVEKLANPPLAFGANCGVGASDLMRTVLGFFAQGSERPVIAKGNAGIPKYKDGAIHYDGTPELMAEYAVLARDAGVRIIGGCCGTMPEHLKAMRKALETRPKGDRPTLDQISGGIGGVFLCLGRHRRRRGSATARTSRADVKANSEQAELIPGPRWRTEQISAQRGLAFAKPQPLRRPRQIAVRSVWPRCRCHASVCQTPRHNRAHHAHRGRGP